MNPSITRPLVRYGLPLGFFVLVGILLSTQLREVEWSRVLGLLRAYPGDLLFRVGALAATSYLVYSCYDLVGRRYLQHRISRLRVMAIAFVSYAFNLNLGAPVGGFAFRYRLYSRAGLNAWKTSQVIGLSLMTNWLGYLVLAGMIFMTAQVPVPEAWTTSAHTLRVIGALLLAAASLYLLLCGFASRRSWSIGQLELRLPSLPMALVQLFLSVINWLLMGSMIYLLLDQREPLGAVLGTLLLAAIAGAVTHIPAGLGVIEAVFIALLGSSVGVGVVLAALLAYRGLYYLAPLALGLSLYLFLEVTARPVVPLPKETAGGKARSK